MISDDGRFIIVYNGEIYNYLEIREQLQKLGYSFRSNSDTEVILCSFKQWGQDCLRRFNGMWSFAILDNEKKELFCSRDRYGVKPFYYYFDGNVFTFASEIKSLLQCPFVKTRPNDHAIYNFLVGTADYSLKETFFYNIYQLPQGNFLKVDESGINIQQYYQLSYNAELGTFKENELNEYRDKFIELLRDAIKIRLRSDVPVGSCLSGGLDSSTIVCIINEILRNGGLDAASIGKRQKTFSSCYDNREYDERQYIEEVIQKTSANSHYIFPSGNELWEELNDLIWHQEEPFGSTSIYAQWNVMRLAKQNNVTVLLDGQGGDELLGGYHHYFINYLNQILYSGHLSELVTEFSALQKNLGLPLYSKFFMFAPLYNILPQHVINIFKSRIIESKDFSVVNSSFLKKYADRQRHPIELNLQKAMWDSETAFGLRELLRYEDKNSMAFSIETRTPFIDYRLVELVFSIPACYKIHKGWTKFLLRESTVGLLPEMIRLRTDKLGFPAPEKIWINEGKEKVKAIFKNKVFRAGDYFDPNKVLGNLDNMLSSSAAGAFTPVWPLINLELWMQRMFK